MTLGNVTFSNHSCALRGGTVPNVRDRLTHHDARQSRCAPCQRGVQMSVTDWPVLVTKTSWSQFGKAYPKFSVRLQRMFAPKHLCVWMSSFVAASTSFLVYATVTRDSAPKNPVASKNSQHMIELSRRSSTVVIEMSRVMTPPCKVFNFPSQDIAAKRRWTQPLCFGPDWWYFGGTVESHTMKRIITRLGVGYIPNQSKNNWLMILEKIGIRDKKQNPSKIQFLFQFLLPSVGWQFWHFLFHGKPEKKSPILAVIDRCEKRCGRTIVEIIPRKHRIFSCEKKKTQSAKSLIHPTIFVDGKSCCIYNHCSAYSTYSACIEGRGSKRFLTFQNHRCAGQLVGFWGIKDVDTWKSECLKIPFR